MSRKFEKGRAVDYTYTKIPLAYPGIKHATHPDKELVLMDQMGKHYVAAYRNMKLNKVGITFLLKAEMRNGKPGFIFKDKWHEVKCYVF